MFKHHLFRVLPVLVLFVSIALAACGPQNESTPEIPTVTVASPSPTESENNSLPIAAWHLDGDGTAYVGASPLEFSGAYEFSDTAVAFDGYTGIGSTSAPGPIDTTASFSVSAWVNYASRVSDVSTAVSQFGKESYAFALGVGDADQWGFVLKNEDRTGGQYGIRISGSQAVPSRSWTHLVGIYDQEAGMLHLYVNGKQEVEGSFAEPFNANGPLTLGSAQFDSHPGNFWPGAIGEVAVYQAALTAEQVAEIYQTTRPSSPPPPQPAPDPSTYANGILNGTWDYVVSDEDARQFFLSEYGVTADEVRVRLGFNDHQWWETPVFDGKPFLLNGIPEGDGGTFRIEGDRIILIGANGRAQITYAWVLDGDQLTLTVVQECDVTTTGLNCHDGRSQMDQIMIMITEHTYTKSGDDGSY